MITRVWHGRTAIRHAESYLSFLLDKGTKEYKQTPGNISIKIWVQKENDHCHFFTVTEWESLDAIKQFAGNEYSKAVYYPEDEGMLLEFEETVKHYNTYTVL